MIGRLKSFNPRVGFGLLECDQTYHVYQRDVYIHKSAVPVPWNIGQTVEFAVQLNGRQQPQAHDVMWIPLDVVPIPPERTAPPKAPEPVASSSVRNERFLGQLKSYATSRGYGFLTSDEMARRHMCDVYLDRSQLPASGRWRIGQVVEFAVSHNARGQPQARSVEWDPVPLLPHAPTSEGQHKPDATIIQSLNRVLALLALEDKSGAVKLTLELQESSDSVDQVSFLLARLGTPTNECCKEMGMSVSATLLLGVAKHLADNPGLLARRVALSLSWCEAIVSLLKPAVDEVTGTQSFDSVMGIAKDALSAASMAAGPSSENATQYQEVMALFSFEVTRVP